MACDVIDVADESGGADELELQAVVIDVVQGEKEEEEEQFDNCDDVDTEVAIVVDVGAVDVIEDGRGSPATLLRINMIGRGDEGALEIIRCFTGDINGGVTIFEYIDTAAYLGVPTVLAATGRAAAIVSACWSLTSSNVKGVFSPI